MWPEFFNFFIEFQLEILHGSLGLLLVTQIMFVIGGVRAWRAEKQRAAQPLRTTGVASRGDGCDQ
jgi:hypothetical protein